MQSKEAICVCSSFCFVFLLCIITIIFRGSGGVYAFVHV